MQQESADKPLGADVIMHEKTGGAQGSNAGGFYRGSDGVDRYVKLYNNPEQAHGEAAANTIYRDLGLGAPNSHVFSLPNGKEAFASDIIPGGKTLEDTGLTKDNAREVLKGFAADVLTGNWDAVGLTYDNILMKNGEATRIDNGSAFLYRAQGGLKPESLLNKATEIKGFFNPAVNREYAMMTKKAGYASAQDIKGFASQVKNIVDLEKSSGGWGKYLDAKAPYLSSHEQSKMADMLTSRTKALVSAAGINASAMECIEACRLELDLLAEEDPWIGVDLDGTLAQYDGWHGKSKIGKPVSKMVDIIKQHLADGDTVKIFTARVADDPGGVAKKAIDHWCKKYLGQKLPITNEKDNGMVKLYDDRAVAVEKNTGKMLSDPDVGASVYAKVKNILDAVGSMAVVIAKIKALPDAPEPTGMWSTLRRAKERSYGKGHWKKTPLKLIAKPKDALAFKLLPVAQRDKLVDDAPVKAFDPHDLVTNQPVVSEPDLIHFAHHGTDPEPAIVLKSTDGLYVHNGNHRSVTAWLSGTMVKAKYIDLSQIPELKSPAIKKALAEHLHHGSTALEAGIVKGEH
jgi:hypothetical protein